MIEQLVPLVRLHDAAWLSQRFPGLFLTRQRVNESPQGFSHFKTPKQIPVPPTSTPSSSSSAMKSLVISSDQEFFDHFAVDPLAKQGRNQFPNGITLGRSSNNDIVILSTTVSKFHAWVETEGLRHYVNDAQSSYGTSVDQVLIPAGQRLECYAGSRIKLGEVTLSLLDAAGLHTWLTTRLKLITKGTP